MVWRLELDSDKTGSVYVDEETDRFIILFPVGTNGSWCVRVGVRSSVTQNQEKCFKNRSRAMISVKTLLKARFW